jgi:hypothetical protein
MLQTVQLTDQVIDSLFVQKPTVWIFGIMPHALRQDFDEFYMPVAVTTKGYKTLGAASCVHLAFLFFDEEVEIVEGGVVIWRD